MIFRRHFLIEKLFIFVILITVYLIDIFDGVLPENAIRITRNTPQEEIDRLEEERRIFYVGITRAKNRLFLFSLQDTPSMFIKELRKPAPQKKNAGPAGGLATIQPDWTPAPGETVYHHGYGRGTITEISANGKYITIRFLSDQIRTFDISVLCANRLLCLYV